MLFFSVGHLSGWSVWRCPRRPMPRQWPRERGPPPHRHENLHGSPAYRGVCAGKVPVWTGVGRGLGQCRPALLCEGVCAGTAAPGDVKSQSGGGGDSGSTRDLRSSDRRSFEQVRAVALSRRSCGSDAEAAELAGPSSWGGCVGGKPAGRGRPGPGQRGASFVLTPKGCSELPFGNDTHTHQSLRENKRGGHNLIWVRTSSLALSLFLFGIKVETCHRDGNNSK